MGVAQAFTGSLLSRTFLERLGADPDAPRVRAADAQAFAAAWRHTRQLANEPSARALADVFAAPTARLLGYGVRGFRPATPGVASILTAGDQAVAVLWVVREPLEHARAAVVGGTAAAGLRWALVVDGAALALIDCARPHARRVLVADAAGCAGDASALRILMSVMNAGALARGADGRSALETMVARSEAELLGIRAALQNGVERAALTLTDALARSQSSSGPAVERLFEEALTVVYRVLFLQFAEARGLVPVWHPTYRRAYTVESLREQVESEKNPLGVWDALQAIARLAHRGARAGELVVVPFNGRLFSPVHAPSVARRAVSDRDAAAAVSALTSTSTTRGRAERIPFLDLGVEQLGSIYERVLDFAPARDVKSGRTVLERGSARKSTGSFYTPRPLTELLVRRTLQPLVSDRAPEEILKLRVLDPAMGSGAFLVAACRFLAQAYEASLRRAGVAGADDFSPRDRAGFRRLIAQHCLFGVDVNPMAVQLGRLSLWLCSLAADKPLSFLDHRLRVGNTIVGVTPDEIRMRAPGKGRPRAAPTLFDESAMESIGRAIDVRELLDRISDDTIEDVRRKEDLHATLESDRGPLASWRAICDAWCATWFWPGGQAPTAREFGAMAAALRGDTGFTHRDIQRRLSQAQEAARSHRFFHWTLEFPEVLSRPNAGFDAIVGNPPWEMVRGYEGTRPLLRFSRDSGIYRLQSSGHSNAYQLFVERTLQLLRQGGRFGLILPWSIATDEGSAMLRRALFDRCALDEFLPLENADGIFPIHRALKFAALSGTLGGSTPALRLRPALRDVAELDRIDLATSDSAPRIELTREFLDRISGGSLAVPHARSAGDVRIAEFLLARAPAASSPNGWNLRFGRELNATDDRHLMTDAGPGYPVIAGRHLRAFQVETTDAPLRIDPEAAHTRIGKAVMRPRLAYRDVSGAGNRMTLIAAIVPPRVATTHTLFCLRTHVSLDDQYFLCAVLNSFVANFFVRMRVGTHVTTRIVGTLPVPRPGRATRLFASIVAGAKMRAAAPGDRAAAARLQASVAVLYGIDAEALDAILVTFPLVPSDERSAVMSEFRRVSST